MAGSANLLWRLAVEIEQIEKEAGGHQTEASKRLRSDFRANLEKRHSLPAQEVKPFQDALRGHTSKR